MSNLLVNAPLQGFYNNKHLPNVNACYGPHQTLSAASSAIAQAFGDNPPKGLTVAVDDGQLKEYWITDNGLELKTNGGSGNEVVVTTAYSITLDNNDTIVLDDDSSGEMVVGERYIQKERRPVFAEGSPFCMVLPSQVALAKWENY